MDQPETRTAGQPHDRTALRQHIAEAFARYDWNVAPVFRSVDPNADHYDLADAVLAVLPEPADRGAEALAERYKADYLSACTQIADMHAAAVGEARGPIRGVVEDVADVRARAEHAEAAVLRKAADEAQQPTAGQPRRGDAFAQWLKAQRDEYEQTTGREWRALNEVLDTYRLHADTGTPLGEHVCEGRAVGDCECLEQQPTIGEQPDTRRERYAAAIRPNMLLGLQDADLSGPGGTERIGEWVDWIAGAVATVADEEQQEMANAAVRFTAAIRRQNERLRTELEDIRRDAGYFQGWADGNGRSLNTALADNARLRAELEQSRATTAHDLLPTWEAMYEPGNVSDYLIGYANGEAGAKGAAEAWLRSEMSDPGRLEWVAEPPPRSGDYDRWVELVRHDPELGECGTGINVRHRAAATPGPVSEDGAQQLQPADNAASPTAQLLATHCDACRHTLTRHTHHGDCTVVLCVCGSFQYPAEEQM